MDNLQYEPKKPRFYSSESQKSNKNPKISERNQVLRSRLRALQKDKSSLKVLLFKNF